jgi:hypothetical protein
MDPQVSNASNVLPHMLIFSQRRVTYKIPLRLFHSAFNAMCRREDGFGD